MRKVDQRTASRGSNDSRTVRSLMAIVVVLAVPLAEDSCLADTTSQSPMPATERGAVDSNYFDPRAVTSEVCVPGQGVWQRGAWGVGFVPLPQYHESTGWEITFDGYVSYGADKPPGARTILDLVALYNEREDRLHSLAALRVWWRRDDGGSLCTPVWYFDLPGREGVLSGLRLLRNGGSGGQWSASAYARIAHERLQPFRSLGDARWQTGHHSWLALDLGLRRAPVGLLRHMEFALAARATVKRWSSDYDYRRFTCWSSYSRPWLVAWLRAGVTAGEPPVQEALDLAGDGPLRSLPLWRLRPTRFLAVGAEPRLHVWDCFYVGAFGTYADARDINGPLWEGGISLLAAYETFDVAPFDWFVQVDLPVYSSDAPRFSERNVWDAGRIMIRVNVPVLGVDGDDVVRYRYPNR